MYGHNEVTSPFYHADGRLLVNSVWPTLQGEGPDAGRPAIFVRLAKCNLRCYFCDTEFDHGEWKAADELAEQIVTMNSRIYLCVITGGEPLLQNVIPLIERLNHHCMKVAIETAGTVYLDGLEHHFPPNLIVCSPKTPKLHERIIPLVGAFKYIVRWGESDPYDGLPSMSTQLQGEQMHVYRPARGPGERPVPIYVQPQDEGDPDSNAANLQSAVSRCLQHGYRLSVQIHKLADLP